MSENVQDTQQTQENTQQPFANEEEIKKAMEERMKQEAEARRKEELYRRAEDKYSQIVPEVAPTLVNLVQNIQPLMTELEKITVLFPKVRSILDYNKITLPIEVLEKGGEIIKARLDGLETEEAKEKLTDEEREILKEVLGNSLDVVTKAGVMLGKLKTTYVKYHGEDKEKLFVAASTKLLTPEAFDKLDEDIKKLFEETGITDEELMGFVAAINNKML